MTIALAFFALTGATAAIAQTPVTAAPAPVAAVAAPSPLAQIPGVAVQYYDVSGLTLDALRASIAGQRPTDPATGQPVPSSSKWAVGTSVRKQTNGKACKIVGATPSFKAEVVMPRLTVVEGVPAPVLAEWQRYVAAIEAQQAASLRSIYDRLSEVEKAVLASTCEGAADAANKAISEISKAPAEQQIGTVPAG
jgi:predicted secreted Zn-dependent protease